MKRIPTLIAILAISLIIFNSCKKDSVDNNNNTNPPAVTSDNYTDKIYLIDSTAAGQDTTQYEVYFYDNLKRVVTIIDTTLNPSELFAKKDFEYAGNDTLPFKSTLYVYDGTNRDTVITYFYFNAVGKLVKDSTIDITKTITPSYYQVRQKVLNISYAAGMMYGYTRDSAMFVNGIPSTNPATIIKDTLTLDGNENIIHSIQHRNSTVYNSTNTFDNQPHPFKRLNIFMCWNEQPFRSSYLDPTQPNTNNITHIEETATGSQNYSRGYDILNSYYSNGYLKTTAHPENAGSPDYEKYVFVYKSL